MPNYHALIVWDWMDHTTGKSHKLSEKDMSEMQDLLADMLKMERGQKKSETGLEHLEREEFILKKLKNEQKAVKEKTEALESEIKGLDFDEEELSVPELETDGILKKAKEDAAKSGGFFDEKELKKAVREFNQLNGQIKGIHGILENIDDMSLSGLQKAVRELKRQAANMLPDSEEWRNNQQQVLVLEDRIKQLKNSFREAKNESEQLTANMDQLVKVMQNIKGSSLNDLLSAQKILEQNVAAAKPGTTSYDTALAQLRDVKD